MFLLVFERREKRENGHGAHNFTEKNRKPRTTNRCLLTGFFPLSATASTFYRQPPSGQSRVLSGYAVACLDMWMRRVIFFFFFSERAARVGVGGGGRCQIYLFILPVQHTTSRIGHRVKYFFFGLATNALNVRNKYLQPLIPHKRFDNFSP